MALRPDCLIGLLPCAALLLGTASATAAELPRVRLKVTGTCPSERELQRSIAAFVRSPRSGEGFFTYRVWSDPDGTAHVQLESPSGDRELERSVQSQDCAALAEAFAIILHARFLDLGFELPERTTPSSDTSTDTEDVEPPPEQRPKPAAEPPAPAPPAGVPESALRIRGTVAVGAGATMRVAPEALTPALQVSLGVLLNRLHLSLAFQGELAQSTGASPNRVERSSLGFALNVGWRFGETWWLEPRVGGGLVLTSVRALDLPDSTTEHSYPGLVGVGVRGGTRWGVLAPWLDLSGGVFTGRDRYVIEGRGPIGEAPAGRIELSAGIEASWLDI